MSASTTAVLILAVFVASSVEAVEAATIVLAVGVTRDWRSALIGAGTGLLVLGALIGALGPALGAIPIDALRFAVGALLLVLGLGWLRKAVLRAAGLKSITDEQTRFARVRDSAAQAPGSGERGASRATSLRRDIDAYGFTVSFKGVLLEGLEVALIVISLGASQHQVGIAAAAAAAAVVVVTAAATAARAPLSRVPENNLKFSVGVLLTSFGAFWAVEGAGATWPGDDLALPPLIAAVLLVALGMTALLRSRARRASAAPSTPLPVASRN